MMFYARAKMAKKLLPPSVAEQIKKEKGQQPKLFFEMIKTFPLLRLSVHYHQ